MVLREAVAHLGRRYDTVVVSAPWLREVPLVETLESDHLDAVPQFKERLEWFLNNRPDLAALVSRWHEPGLGERRQVRCTPPCRKPTACRSWNGR